MPAAYNSAPFFQVKYNELLALQFDFKKAPTLIVTITTSALDEGLLRFLKIMTPIIGPKRAKDDQVMASIYYQFRAKQIISAITGNPATGRLGIFGKVEGYMARLEYQQNSLPHHHILLWMAEEDAERLRLDGIAIRSTTPDKERDPLMYDTIITRHLGLHGCRPDKCLLVNAKKCSKAYPRKRLDMVNVYNNRY